MSDGPAAARDAAGPLDAGRDAGGPSSEVQAETAAPDARAPDVACAWPGAGELLAEWRADGTLDNAVPCSPWAARMTGTVPYGPGRMGRAWQFRSRQTSAESDPNFVAVAAAAGRVMPTLTVDAWVNQTHQIDYNESNRFIASSVWPTLSFAAPGDWALYVHESHEAHFYLRTGPGRVQGVDSTSCAFRAADTPLGTWVRYTATYDGATLRCYRNGQLITSAPLPAGRGGPQGELFIGRNYPGDVDALRVFGRALSATEIVQSWP